MSVLVRIAECVCIDKAERLGKVRAGVNSRRSYWTLWTSLALSVSLTEVQDSA